MVTVIDHELINDIHTSYLFTHVQLSCKSIQTRTVLSLLASTCPPGIRHDNWYRQWVVAERIGPTTGSIIPLTRIKFFLVARQIMYLTLSLK